MTQTARKAREVEDVLHDMTRPLLRLVPKGGGMEAMISATNDVIKQPMHEIAKDLGKNVGELTAYDVIVYTQVNMPKAIGSAMFDVMQEQVASWQSFLGSIARSYPFLTPINEK